MWAQQLLPARCGAKMHSLPEWMCQQKAHTCCLPLKWSSQKARSPGTQGVSSIKVTCSCHPSELQGTTSWGREGSRKSFCAWLQTKKTKHHTIGRITWCDPMDGFMPTTLQADGAKIQGLGELQRDTRDVDKLRQVDPGFTKNKSDLGCLRKSSTS